MTTTTDEFDSGSRCSLREALWAANNDSAAQARGCTPGAGGDEIVVQSGRLTLTRTAMAPDETAENAGIYGDLDVTAPVSIVHRGIRAAVIDSRVPGERVFHVLSGGVSMQGVTITGGDAIADPNNHGGGILNAGALTLRDSTIFGNSATFGGGLSTEGASSAALVNVTISGNSASEDGGGISVETGGAVRLKNVTVADNTADSDSSGGGDGGGAFTSSSGGGGTLRLRDTLLAGNDDRGTEAPDCAKLGGTIRSLGHNLVGNANGCDYGARRTDVVNRSARLLQLEDNGGPTRTHALRKNSPAINEGARCAGTDQRGVRRRLGGRCDIGAWELTRCRGVVINRIGNSGPNLLRGTSRADGILALGGADTLRGLEGRDGLCGGAGRDRLEGGAGNDRMDGGRGRDTCRGGKGRNSSVRCELPRGRNPGRQR